MILDQRLIKHFVVFVVTKHKPFFKYDYDI